MGLFSRIKSFANNIKSGVSRFVTNIQSKITGYTPQHSATTPEIRPESVSQPESLQEYTQVESSPASRFDDINTLKQKAYMSDYTDISYNQYESMLPKTSEIIDTINYLQEQYPDMHIDANLYEARLATTPGLQEAIEHMIETDEYDDKLEAYGYDAEYMTQQEKFSAIDAMIVGKIDY